MASISASSLDTPPQYLYYSQGYLSEIESLTGHWMVTFNLVCNSSVSSHLLGFIEVNSNGSHEMFRVDFPCSFRLYICLKKCGWMNSMHNITRPLFFSFLKCLTISRQLLKRFAHLRIGSDSWLVLFVYDYDNLYWRHNLSQ